MSVPLCYLINVYYCLRLFRVVIVAETVCSLKLKVKGRDVARPADPVARHHIESASVSRCMCAVVWCSRYSECCQVRETARVLRLTGAIFATMPCSGPTGAIFATMRVLGPLCAQYCNKRAPF